MRWCRASSPCSSDPAPKFPRRQPSGLLRSREGWFGRRCPLEIVASQKKSTDCPRRSVPSVIGLGAAAGVGANERAGAAPKAKGGRGAPRPVFWYMASPVQKQRERSEQEERNRVPSFLCLRPLPRNLLAYINSSRSSESTTEYVTTAPARLCRSSARPNVTLWRLLPDWKLLAWLGPRYRSQRVRGCAGGLSAEAKYPISARRSAWITPLWDLLLRFSALPAICSFLLAPSQPDAEPSPAQAISSTQARCSKRHVSKVMPGKSLPFRA